MYLDPRLTFRSEMETWGISGPQSRSPPPRPEQGHDWSPFKPHCPHCQCMRYAHSDIWGRNMVARNCETIKQAPDYNDQTTLRGTHRDPPPSDQASYESGAPGMANDAPPDPTPGVKPPPVQRGPRTAATPNGNEAQVPGQGPLSS